MSLRYDEAVFLEALMRLVLGDLALVLACTGSSAQEIPAAEAAKHVGENTTVCGTIASEHTAKTLGGEVSTLRSCAPRDRSLASAPRIG